jgi:type II secretory ATPase GspE/PulE/Tfp pilus assembly ATPase PilB-like protein
VAQRLVRTVCNYCAEQYHLSEDECKILGINYDETKNIHVSIGAGCPQCRGTGYLGRIGVFEVMEITEKLRAAIESKATPAKIKGIAKSEGFSTLRESAIKVLLKGITTFDEIVRVTGLLT